MTLESMYGLSPEEFYAYARQKFIDEQIYQDEQQFIADQLKRMELLVEKYQRFDSGEIAQNPLPKKNYYYKLISFIEYFKSMQPQQPDNTGKQVQPIWWKGSNRLLRYLMDELAKLDLIDRNSPVNKHIKEHFIDQYQKPFSDSIKQNSSGAGLNKSGKPKGHDQIDGLIKSLKQQQEKND